MRIKPHPSQSQTFTTMRDAKAWAQELELKLKNEKKGDFDHIIFRDTLIDYRDSVSALSKNSIREKSRINYILKNMQVDIPLTNVNKEILVAWCELRLENVSGSTVRREQASLAGFFTWCIESKLWLKSNPMKGVLFPKASDHRERVILDFEIEKLLPFLNDQLKSIFLLALETGMRQSEICGLEWEGIYLDKSFLFLKTTKNGRSREVPLSKKAKEILADLEVKKSGNVFEYEAHYVSLDFMKARIEAELLDIVFHDTRHTAATKIALKLPLLDLCKMFGWTDPKRAMIYYNPTSTEIASWL